MIWRRRHYYRLPTQSPIVWTGIAASSSGISNFSPNNMACPTANVGDLEIAGFVNGMLHGWTPPPWYDPFPPTGWTALTGVQNNTINGFGSTVGLAIWYRYRVNGGSDTIPIGEFDWSATVQTFTNATIDQDSVVASAASPNYSGEYQVTFYGAESQDTVAACTTGFANATQTHSASVHGTGNSFGTGPITCAGTEVFPTGTVTGDSFVVSNPIAVIGGGYVTCSIALKPTH